MEPPHISRWTRVRALLPFLVAGGLFLLGVTALYHLLAPVDLADVQAQIRATRWSTLAIAVGATLCGYLALAGYDWSALRYIGRPLPLPVVLTGGLMAYAFGNTMGLSALSGGAVRWRIYSGLGLDAYQVAKVSTFAAVSFGLAATVVGLAALAAHPDALAAVLPFSTGIVRAGALLGILIMTLPLIFAAWRRSVLRLGRLSVRAPSPPVLAAQVLFSLADITFSALTLYLLLPPTGVGFFTFLAIFAAATMAGIISHVPGGIGVFETVVIAALPAGTPVESVAAALLLYRIIYFILPFTLALLVLALYEAMKLGGHLSRLRPGGLVAAAEPALRAVEPLAPLVLAVMIVGSGLWMTFSALIPRHSGAADALEELFPLAFLEGSALLTSALGAALVVLALGVARRSEGAFLLALAAIGVGIGVALVQGPDLSRAIALAGAALLLLPFRRSFNRRTRLTHAAMTPPWMALVAGAVAAFGFVLFFAHRSTPYAHELWWQFAVDADAPRALRAGLVASLAVGVWTLWLLLRAPRLRPAPPTAEDLARAAALVAASEDPDLGFALTGDKTLIFSDEGDAMLMFGVQGRSWIALGAPSGPPEARADLAFTFVDSARRAGARPVFYEVGEQDLPLMLELGLGLFKLGEEAVVDLTTFTLDGPARKKLRAAHARALRDGLTLEILAPPHSADLIAALREVSDQWLSGKKVREKGFSVGRFDPDWLGRWPVAVVRHEGRIVAFANLMVTGSGQNASLDLMRHSGAAPAGVMEFLFTELMLQLAARGVRRFSLGMAPLAGLEPRKSRRLWDRFGAALFRHGGDFYNFTGLRAFKAKFGPQWRPRYLAAPGATTPLLPLADAALLVAGGARGVIAR
ncbi:bifunctional lysylphosphatidylglycerol flippase/synthetase MprF [Plastorhodobacter daqingensis]|uniref:Phosphatidylglycerol lysyltransferase n=1 Tax=Plastorhodobacter daqingensis TaxID=1387281 RepID=A0ABW2UKF8_9RHOB